MSVFTIADVAEIAHEVNRVYCLSIGEDPSTVLPHWEYLTPDIQAHTIAGVQYFLDHPNDNYPDDLHNAWLENKVKDGWIYGTVKDIEKKEHPCLLPYEMLPYEQKFKDVLFRQVMCSFKDYIIPADKAANLFEAISPVETIDTSK